MLPIDLRSDTVTLPTKEMRKAMYAADVGDDGYGDDPTVLHLEKMVAQQFGKEAALYVPSGTLGNILAIQTYREQRGKHIILGSTSHLNQREIPRMQDLLQLELVQIDDWIGWMDVNSLKQYIGADTALICLENTHNFSGGTVLPIEYMHQIHTLAKQYGIPLHLDGARLWNAMVATGLKEMEYAKYVDSLMVCLSKGLSAPVGSLLIGSKGFIEQARRWRKSFGGTMRQAGILAAAGIVALNSMVERLADDHLQAKRLAEGLADINGLMLSNPKVETNIVIIQLNVPNMTAQELTARLKKEGILVKALGERQIRLTTHRHIQREHVDYVVKKLHEIMVKQ